MNRLALQRSQILAVKVGVAIGLVAWLVLSDRLHWSRLASIRFSWNLVALFALVAGSMIIPAIRWWWLLRIQGLQEPLWRVVKLTWSGYLAALILPGAASGDLAKSFLILRDNKQARARAFSTVVADRFLGLFSLLLVGAVSAVWMTLRNGSNATSRFMMVVTLSSVIALTAGVGSLLVPAPRRFVFRVLPTKWRESWNESFGLYLGVLPQLSGCFALSFAGALMTTAAFVFSARSLEASITWDYAFLVGPLVVVANCLPISPGGIGVAESVSSELFGAVSISHGAEVMALTRICTSTLSLFGLFTLNSVCRNRSVVLKSDHPAVATSSVAAMINSGSEA